MFVLVVAGNASAGVCACLKPAGSKAHACCKPKKAKNDSVSRKGCCERDCLNVKTESNPRVAAERAPSFQTGPIVPAPMFLSDNDPFATVAVRTGGPVVEKQRPKRAPPPDIFLLNSSFRI
jgi:hypothetical protein